MDLGELLLTVKKPGRYAGGEWNSVKKEWSDGMIKVLLAFPDLYEIGSSYLGIKILYGILNARDDCLCERAFSPWQDFEEGLRKNKISLFSLESRHPIRAFDIIGFSLAYELTFTNVLNMLDLGNIPVRSRDRTDDDPLIIAGGPSCYNPEPMAEFIDAFLIGDGEEAMPEIIEAYKASRRQGVKTPRQELVRRLARIEGVYAPSLYKVEYNYDRTIKKFSPVEDCVPDRITKRVVKNLDGAFYPTKQIVPNISIVHDRLAIEIMRGCKHACRFCQATATYRPCRERTIGEILRIARESYRETGYDEISLLSLSSGDHTRIKDIIEKLNEEFHGLAVSVSVPSLRIEDVLKDLPILISKVKKSGLTFAPESGSDCLRKIINKNIDMEKLFRAASEYYRNGWRRVKLYFMLGLPHERDEDVLRIPELIYKISNLKRDIDGRSGFISASINAFIPKPHTAFQWKSMDPIEELEHKKEILRGAVKSRFVELDFHSFGMSRLEAILSRGDRSLSQVIYESWRSGARFDGWQDVFNLNIWLDAFKRCGVDDSFYLNRERRFDEILPWDFIDIGVKKESLLKEINSLPALI
ncbi:MAG: TIGR03960 family B12-binding radical SAM protein [Candidatus Omnitrophota bacterium]|nr:TIGR03960 family B12-binding radical SAM protein [Candidatus Omnitrophota bacterium]